jgi:hypothetical protein
MSAFEDAEELVRHAERKLAEIRQQYERSLNRQRIRATLLVDIKNFFENLRSALDFSARGVFDQYGSSARAKQNVYFPYATASQSQSEFEKSGRIETCIPGLTASRPDIVKLLLDMQHFGSLGNGWLPDFMALTNENKHQKLTPQVRRETKELRVSGGGASMTLSQGASISVGSGASISVGGAMIRGGQTIDVNNPPVMDGGRSEVVSWVSFHFEHNDRPVYPFLETAHKGISDIVGALRSQ